MTEQKQKEPAYKKVYREKAALLKEEVFPYSTIDEIISYIERFNDYVYQFVLEYEKEYDNLKYEYPSFFPKEDIDELREKDYGSENDYIAEHLSECLGKKSVIDLFPDEKVIKDYNRKYLEDNYIDMKTYEIVCNYPIDVDKIQFKYYFED